uniref:Uncharacterized protein n=1 Tax=Anopheles darlingi TaxID=43151 RepID=A0A2M4D1U1_ANODA
MIPLRLLLALFCCLVFLLFFCCCCAAVANVVVYYLPVIAIAISLFACLPPASFSRCSRGSATVTSGCARCISHGPEMAHDFECP